MSENNSVTKQARQTPQEKQDRREDRRDVAMTPQVDVVEDATAITLLADLPGVSKEKLSVQFESDNLTIEGEVSFEMPEGMESSHAEVRLPGIVEFSACPGNSIPKIRRRNSKMAFSSCAYQRPHMCSRARMK